jgi:hypothetical protein
MHAQIEIHFEEDNAAFEDDPGEWKRIVDEALAEAKSVMEGGIPPSGAQRTLRDYNGNPVGRVEITHGL